MDMGATVAKGIGSSVLLAFGISMTFDSFIAGMVLALFAASFAILAVPDRSRGEFFFSIGTGLFVAALVAIHGQPVIPGISSMQANMGIVGGGARFVFLLVPKLFQRVVSRADDLADTAINKVTGDK